MTALSIDETLRQILPVEGQDAPIIKDALIAQIKQELEKAMLEALPKKVAPHITKDPEAIAHYKGYNSAIQDMSKALSKYLNKGEK